MATRKRFFRKDLKQPDEFLSTTDRILAFFKENQGVGVSVLIGFLMIGGITAFFFKKRQVQAMRMESVLHEMNQVLNRGEGTEVLVKYIDDFIDGVHKKRAKIILADAYFMEKKFNDAIKLYQEVIQKTQTGDLLFDLARLGLGYSYEQNKDSSKAIETYKALIDGKGTLPVFNIYFSLARVYEQKKDYKNAILIMREMQNQFQDHEYFSQILEKTQELEKLA